MWEISENLDRAELTVQQRHDQIAEWIELNGSKKPAQVEPVSKGGRGKVGGVNDAVRELGVERNEARRAVKIAAIEPKAKAAAKVAGLDMGQGRPADVRALFLWRRQAKAGVDHAQFKSRW
jgi:hypothetical protein